MLGIYCVSPVWVLFSVLSFQLKWQKKRKSETDDKNLNHFNLKRLNIAHLNRLENENEIMGNFLTKLCCVRKTRYQSLNLKQRERLGEFFQYIISNAPVDYTNQEIQDIQNAVSIMLERIRTRVNRRGIFNIARIVPNGSAAEKTSVWKFDIGDHYLEFDFLAILKNGIKQCEDQTSLQDCQGCIKIVNPPMELKRLRQYYNKNGEFSGYNLKYKDVISDLFLNEINHCLTLSCDCLSIQCDKDQVGNYTISLRPSSKVHLYGCGECTVDMPTGTLHVNTEIKIDQNSNNCPNVCSVIFQWTSKTKTLLAPDQLLLRKPQPISSLPIYVDFLPALESLKPNSPGPPGPGDEHDFFIVPKSCNVCSTATAGFRNFMCRWRKSCCMAEIYAITTDMSDKHRRCYQIIKYLSEARVKYKLPKYHIKTAVLRHQTTCSDSTDHCVDCVMGILRELLLSYETEELLSYQSNFNILTGQRSYSLKSVKDRCKQLINRLSVTDSWETFIRKT